MRERVPPGDVIDEKRSCSPAVVGTCDAFERLLARSVPYLELYVLFVNLNCPCAELHSDRQVVLLAEPFVGELQQKARFTHA